MTAELADHASWKLLITLARSSGHDEMAQRFEVAQLEEELFYPFVRDKGG